MSSEKTPLLQAEHLRQYFNKNTFRAVDDISFYINKGEVLGLVGESGCGKTTTGRAIIKLHRLTGGTVYFNGKAINAGILDYTNEIARAKKDFCEFCVTHKGCRKEIAAEKEKRDRIILEQKKLISEAKRINASVPFQTKIQMIFQDPSSSLDSRMTVREIIAEGLRIQGEKNEQVISKTVSDALVKVGLRPEYCDRYPHEFSGGQRQRIGIARAIVMNPELIIADEPVSALDVSVKAQVINLLNKLKKEMGLTILFIAHDLSVVKYFSDRIAVMYAGKIVETASSKELFERPLHPYTKALLSAIPLPDPEYEKNHKRLVYDPHTAHDYTKESPSMREIFPGHQVFCSQSEAELYKKTGTINHG